MGRCMCMCMWDHRVYCQCLLPSFHPPHMHMSPLGGSLPPPVVPWGRQSSGGRATFVVAPHQEFGRRIWGSPCVLLGTRFARRHHSSSPRPSPALGRGTHPLSHRGKRSGGAVRSLCWHGTRRCGAARRDALSTALGSGHGSPSPIIARGDGTVACLSRAPGLLCALDPCLHYTT